jgi:hypothetical protein
LPAGDSKAALLDRLKRAMAVASARDRMAQG